MDIKYYLRKAQDVQAKDYLSVFPMLLGLILTPFYRKRLRDCWAVCERSDEARDNGYHFFKYVKEKHPHQKCFYAIDKKCHDYEKVEKYKTVVEFGSVKHWLLYFSCKFLISSQSFKPNAYLCTLIERSGMFRPHHVFFQHGITINKPDYLEASRRKVDYFITVTPQETEFVANELGYGSECVRMLGFPRFDALHEFKVEENMILIMPTWRKWLRLKSEGRNKNLDNDDLNEYIDAWTSLLENQEFRDLTRDKNLKIVFIMHSNMKEVISADTFMSDSVNVVDLEKCDLQSLMKSASMMITDYSSVFFDMVYMKKPVIFYQFDEEKFRSHHYKKGWFDYKQTPFGEWCETVPEVMEALSATIEKNYVPSDEYIKEHSKMFTQYDTENSKRVYSLLSNCNVMRGLNC